MERAEKLAFDLTEQGYIPDLMTRRGIRRLIRQRLRELNVDDVQAAADALNAFITEMQTAPIAVHPDMANQQHYEIPPAFFAEVLGRHRKYSACYWPAGVDSLDGAEAASLAETCRRADLGDYQEILDLGSGWGSLTLWAAHRYPRSRITAVTNSGAQRDHILSEAWMRGLDNVEVIVCDMNSFESGSARYDRVVSIEMFEHMRNWAKLYSNIAGWLKPGGKFFKHIFVQRTVPYLFEDNGVSDWMSRHFFTGGMMPSDDLPLFFQEQLAIEGRWRWSGLHYAKTANAWLANMDRHQDTLWPVLEQVYGDNIQLWWARWRIFFMACAELFGYDEGRQWWISHYRFTRREG